MLKINLLPPYIHQRRNMRIAIGVVTVAVAAEVALFIMMMGPPMRKAAELDAEIQDTNSKIQALNDIKPKADQANAEEAAFKPKYDFFNDQAKYNRAYPDLYTRTAHYTYSDVTMLDLAAAQTALQFHVYASRPTDVSRLMIGLTNDPDIAPPPVVSSPPGYTQGQDAASQSGGPLSQSTIIGGQLGGGASSMMGMPGMSGGAPPGFGAMAGGMSSGMSSMGSGGMSSMMSGGMSGGAPPGFGAMAGGSGGMAARMSGGMGAGGGSGSLNVFGVQAARKQPKGFVLQVSCTLANPIARPSFGSAGAQGGGGGMGGMMGMMGGGVPPGFGGMAGGNSGMSSMGSGGMMSRGAPGAAGAQGIK